MMVTVPAGVFPMPFTFTCRDTMLPTSAAFPELTILMIGMGRPEERSIDTNLPALFDTAKSGKPSPLKSAL